MTTMTHPATTSADVRSHPIATAALVLLFWIAAAALVTTSHAELDPLSRSGGSVAAIAAILVVAFAYTRLCARNAGMSHALGVGIAWLVLAIVAEITVSARSGHAWYALIGSPARPLLRNILLFVWIFAPSLFARPEVRQ